MTYFPQRIYPRAKFYDYNVGDFFITVCTHNMIHYFGEIYDEEMHLSEIGKFLESTIENIAEHFDDVQIPPFCSNAQSFSCNNFNKRYILASILFGFGRFKRIGDIKGE